MNSIEKKMITILNKLKLDHNVIEIKAEFESEATRLEELHRLKDVTSKADLPIILKIGGAEAITDLYIALTIGAKGIVAPMVETPFAVSKFIEAVSKYIPKDNLEDIDAAINIETITSVENLDQILQLDQIKLLSSMTIGRVDLVGSMGLERTDIESKKVTDIVSNTLQKIKSKGFKTAVGGAISTDAIENIKAFISNNLIDKFETRKVVFSANTNLNSIKDGILLAIQFEYLWLVSKQRYYGRIREEDTNRIVMIEKRLTDSGINIRSL